MTDILISIKNRLENENNSVTYSWLQNKFGLSPKDSQEFLLKYLDLNNATGATYLRHEISDNIHKLITTEVFSESAFIISLQNKKTSNNKKSILSDFELCTNPPIICDEAKLLTNNENKIFSESNNKLINTTKIVQYNSTHVKEYMKQPKCEIEDHFSSSKENIIRENLINQEENNSEFDFPDDDSFKDIVDDTIKKHEPVSLKTGTSKTKDKSIKIEKQKNKPKKVKLFKNFEDESPKILKKRRVIESDSDDEKEKIHEKLIDDSLQEESVLKKENINLGKKSDAGNVVIKEVGQETVEKSMKKVQKTYVDEEGFLVVETCSVFVTVNNNKPTEIPETKSKPINKVGGKKSKSTLSKCKDKQTNITNFFKKQS